MFGCHANLHSVENWELVCLNGSKLSFLGVRSFCAKIYSFIMGQGTSHAFALWVHCTVVHVGRGEQFNRVLW